MKVLIIILFTVSFSMSVYAQNIGMDNDSVDYLIEYVSIELDEEEDNVITPSKYVVVIDLTETQKEGIKKLSYKDWERLLTDINTDFVSNLLLYSLFERDATLLDGLNRDEWLKCCKSDDIHYWLKFLTQNKVILE